MDGILKSQGTAASSTPPATGMATGGAQGFNGNDQGWAGSLVGQFLGSREGMDRASAGGMEPNAFTDILRRFAPSFASHVADTTGFPNAPSSAAPGPSAGGGLNVGAQPAGALQMGGGMRRTPGPGPNSADVHVPSLPAHPFLGVNTGGKQSY